MEKYEPVLHTASAGKSNKHQTGAAQNTSRDFHKTMQSLSSSHDASTPTTVKASSHVFAFPVFKIIAMTL